MNCFGKKSSYRKVLSDILDSKIFWAGLLLKVVLAGLFASEFLTDLFLPFVNFYGSSGFSNPYNHFFFTGNTEAFPYPTLMLWLIALPYYSLFFIIGNSADLLPFLSVFALRISVLIADFAILVIFARWLRQSSYKLLLFYWLSPVLIYINYIHGQLDCIPISILLASLYFLFRERFMVASIILAAAVSCKTNIILAVPFFFICLFAKKIPLRELLLCVLSFLLTFMVVNLPFLFSEGFLQMVFFNSKQSLVFDVFYNFASDRVFYFIPAIYFALTVKAIMIKGYNRDIFIMFLGFSFGVLNLFIPPMQGWYYWVIPFFAYFYIKQKHAPHYLFFALQAFYFIYFLTTKDSDYFQIFQLISSEIANKSNLYHSLMAGGFDADKVVNLGFTFLQASLLLNCFWIYRSGINSYMRHKLVSKPYLIGISGDSGVGKTTLVSSIKDVFGQSNVTTICGDDMHKWERGHEKWQEYTHLNPSANKLHSEVSFLKALKDGQKIMRRSYDHGCGKFTELKNIEPKKIIVFEGLHSFYVAPVRNLFDVKIFVKPEKQLQRHWKIIRDQAKRGHSKDKILEQIKLREKDSEKFISSQEKYADVKIELFASQAIKNIGDKDENIDLRLRISFGNSIDVESFIDTICKIDSLEVEHGFDQDDQQFIVINGNAKTNKIKQQGDILIGQNFEEINLREPKWSSDLTGLIQMFLSFYIIQTELSDEAKNI